MGVIDRLQHGWNAFMNKDPTNYNGYGRSYRPDRIYATRGNYRSIVNAVYNRIALDVAAVTLRENIDQTSRAFIQDVVLSVMDEGCIAIVPVDTNIDPDITNGYDIDSMRVGKIVEWFPQHIKAEVYNDKKGRKQTIIMSKKDVAIIENPLYSVINEPNSVMQRLIHKLNLLDAVDERCCSGKLDLIIQLPYTIKTEARQRQAEQRKASIENQLFGSPYGIAYIDGTEKITQLNRPVENNLMKQIEYLTNMLYSQLGITQAILDGSADEKTMLNY